MRCAVRELSSQGNRDTAQSKRGVGRRFESGPSNHTMNETDIPRRIQLEKMVPAERAIFDAMGKVEDLPADVRLTEAVVFLQAARDKVADYVDGKP